MLVYKYGGGSFLIPYAICLFGIGLPLLLLELTLGRHYQGGDAKVMHYPHYPTHIIYGVHHDEHENEIRKNTGSPH